MVFSFSNNNRGGSGIGCLIFAMLGVAVLYYFFKFLWWAAPGIFLLAVIINWRAVVDTGKQYWTYLQRNIISGLAIGVLSVLLFPLVALFMLLKSLGYNLLGQFRQNMGMFGNAPNQPAEIPTEYTDFEELESTPKKPERGAEPPEVFLLPKKDDENP